MNEGEISELMVDGINYVVDGINYEVLEEGTGCYTVMCGDENFAEVNLSGCGRYYEYEYSPMFASMDECSGYSEIYKHDGILDFFNWLIRSIQ